MYETDVTWGDEIAFGNEDGVTVVGVLMQVTYYTKDGGRRSPAILNTTTGDLIIYGQTRWISSPYVVYSDSWYAEQGLCGHYGIVCP